MPRNHSQSRRETSQSADRDDMPPTGDEAHEQRKATSMPVVWLGLGLGVMAAFVVILCVRFGVPHPAVGPATTPPPVASPPAKLSR
jgi:hypothetical protein